MSDERIAAIRIRNTIAKQVYAQKGLPLADSHVERSDLLTALDATTARLREAEGLVKELADDVEAYVAREGADYYRRNNSGWLSHAEPAIKGLGTLIRARAFLKGPANG